jgi:succinate dehydrogenase / fumarate reductase flavoprotein subunit
VGASKLAVYLDFRDAIKRDGEDKVREKYGNLFQMYQKITSENPYQVPMRIYPAVHYTMGGLWVDYNLMSTVPGLHVLGEANFSDHGANRLGASALMQGLADGYFVIPATLNHYFAANKLEKVTAEHEAFRAAKDEQEKTIQRLLASKGGKSALEFHRELGHIMWEKCGMSRNEAGLKQAISEIQNLREEYRQNVRVPGDSKDLNQELETASRVGDYLELGELMCLDALERNESCGGHFREEYQVDGECKRDDENFAHAAVWESQGAGKKPIRHKEDLDFEYVHLAVRSYK